MATEEARDHDGLRRLAWIVVVSILGILAFVSLVALGHVVRDVAGRFLFSLGVFRMSAGWVQAAALLLVLLGASLLPIIIIVRLVRARTTPSSPGDRGVFREAFSLPVLIAVALLVLTWSALFQPFGLLATGPLVTTSAGLFYLGLLLLGIGITLFVTDPRLSRSSASVTVADSEGAIDAVSNRRGARERRREEGSHLGAFTLGALFIIVAILGLLGSFGPMRIDVRIFPALVLTVLAGGLFVGTWVGRARWLTILCVLTLPFVALVNVIGVPFAGGVGSVTYAPQTPADLQPSYSLAAGEMTLDLSALETTHADATVSASLATGALRIEVPQGVHVVVDTSVRAGEIYVNRRMEGSRRTGLDLTDSSTFGSDSPGLLHVFLHCGICSVQINVAPDMSPQKPNSNAAKAKP